MSAGNTRLQHSHLEQAADWFARRQGAAGDPQVEANWRQWFEASEVNRQAWHYIERVSQRFAGLHEQGPVAHQVLSGQRRDKRSRRQVLGSLGLLCGGALLGWIGWQPAMREQLAALGARYRTSAGELRREVLADGTQLWLNADTALDVSFDSGQRLFQLYAGEVLIETAKDPRPLRVHTRAGELRPLGTRFSVRTQGERTLLNIYQGAVQASCAESGARVTAEAGQGLSFDARAISAVTPAQAQREAWSKGLLLAEDMPLGQFIEELAPWCRGHLGVSPQVAELRVMGSFSLRDTAQTLAQLEEVLPVRVVRRFSWWATVEPR